MKTLKLTALLLAASLICAVPVAKAEVVWDRQADWAADPATTTVNGPGNFTPDFAKNPTYKNVWTTGSGLNDPTASNRWYAQIGTPMVWDPSWAGGTKKLFAQELDTAPNIRWDLMSQVTSGATRMNAPVVQWHNPTDAVIGIKVTGSIDLQWFGWDYVIGGNPTVDVVVSLIGPSHGDIQDLATWSVNRRDAEYIPGSSSGRHILLDDLDITPAYAAVGPDDMLVWSLRTRQPDYNQGPDTIVRMLDDITITQVDMSEVPEPLTVGLLLCGGMGMLARRRRRRRMHG